MAKVPLVSAPLTGPSDASNLRTDPNIGAPLAAAQQHLAAGIDSAAGFVAQVKHAKDTAFVIGAESKLEAAHDDFRTWTLKNPDTSAWQKEWDTRRQAAEEEIQLGSTSLTPMAKQHLRTATQGWQRRTNSANNLLSQQQDIKNAIGEAESSLWVATSNNDEAGARVIIATGLSTGLWNGAHAAALEKRVVLGISTNQANLDAQADPFTAPELLSEKDADGNFVNYHGLTPAARASMVFRASKLASETRATTMRSWAQLVADAHDNGTPMPDREGIDQEAARQGIAPKWVDKLFKPPAAYSESEFASAHSDISKLDLVNDPAGEHMAHAVALATQFKGFAAEQLQKLIRDRADKNHPLNSSPVFKQADGTNEQNFRLGVYGKFETRVYDPKTGAFHTVVNQSVLKQAQLVKARTTDALMKFMATHPDATHEEATKFLSGIYRAQASKAGAELFKFNP